MAQRLQYKETRSSLQGNAPVDRAVQAILKTRLVALDRMSPKGIILLPLIHLTRFFINHPLPHIDTNRATSQAPEVSQQPLYKDSPHLNQIKEPHIAINWGRS